MDVLNWYQTAAAVFAGNILTAMFGYFFWAARQREKQGLDPMRLPIGVCLCGVIPPLVLMGGAYLLV